MRSTTPRWPAGPLVALALIAALTLHSAAALAADLAVNGPPLAAERARSLARAALADPGWGALAAAMRLDEPAVYLAPEDARALYLELAARLSAAPTTEPRRLAAAHLLQRASRFDDYLGQGDAARARARGLGLVDAWIVAGPFENGNMAGFDVAYGPEDRFDPADRFEGKIGPVAWRPFGLSVRGYNPISAAMNPDRSVVAYAATLVDSPKAQKAVLRVGANGAYKVWVNGQRVARVDTDLGGELDRDAFGLRLERGANTVLVKLAGESRGQLGLFLRFTQPDGTPLALAASAEIPTGALLASPAPHKGAFEVADPAAAAAALARGDKGGPRPLVDAARLSRSLRELDPLTPWRDLADAAALAAPADAAVLMDAAAVQPDHWRRLKLMRAASALAPEDGWLLVELAYEVNQSTGLGHLPEAMVMADRAHALVGGQPGAALLPTLLKARLLSGQGAPARALALLEPLRASWPRCEPLLSTLHGLYGALGHSRQAQLVYDDMVANRQLVPGVVQNKAREQLRASAPAEALATLDALLERRPDAISAQLLRARALEQLERSDEALAALDAVLSMSPGLMSALEEKGRLLERLGRPEEALATYEEAQLVEPENAGLAERVRSLRPESSSFEAAWRWDSDLMTPEPGAAEAHAGQDFYFIGQQVVVKVAPSGAATRFWQRVVHVLNDEGAKAWRSSRIYYSPGFERAEVVSVRVRKPDGTIAEAHRRQDYDAGQGAGNLYYLRRFAYIDVPALSPGDVIEYAWREIDVGAENFREGYFGDIWYFDSSVDIERARYVVLTPEAMKLHVRKPDRLASLTETVEPREIEGRPFTAHAYEARDVPRVKEDPKMPGSSEVNNYILLSTYETWDQVGLWWWNLIKDQLVVDAEIEAVVKQVTAGITDDRQKVSAIYDWVVKNTRYVGIEFGVHGWKPYRTTLCMRRRFGDCKDKASLIKVMLNAAGVDANLVLIRTRTLGAVATSPPNLSLFNHAIAYVPKFDLFLDGTAEFSGTKELPGGDQGQLCVIVADGGKVTVRLTPVDDQSANAYVRILDVDLRGESPRVTGELNAVGGDAVFFRSRFDSAEKRVEELEQILSRAFPGARLLTSDFVEVRDLEKPVQIRFTMEGGAFVKQSGDTRILFPTGREIHLLDTFAPSASRDQDLILGVPFTFTNKVTYHLPTGTRVGSAPQSLSASSPFGSYKIDVSQNGDAVSFDVTYTTSVNRISVKDYPAWRDWLNEMDRAVNQRLVLIQSEE